MLLQQQILVVLVEDLEMDLELKQEVVVMLVEI